MVGEAIVVKHAQHLPAPPDDKGNPLAHSTCVNRTDDERQEWRNCKSGPVYPSSLFCNPARSRWWALWILAECQNEAPVPVILSFVVESLSRYDTRTSPTPTRRPQGGSRRHYVILSLEHRGSCQGSLLSPDCWLHRLKPDDTCCQPVQHPFK